MHFSYPKWFPEESVTLTRYMCVSFRLTRLNVPWIKRYTFTFTYIFCCVLIEEPLVVGITNACYILQDMSFLLAVFWRLKNEIVILFSRKQGVKILPFLRLRFDMPDITYVLFLGIQGHRTERDYTLKFCCFFLWTDRRSLHRAASVVDVQ